MATLADEFLRRELGAGIAGPRFYVASTGCVLGVDLDDGRGVVVKVHQPVTAAPVLAAVQRVQRHLHERGFPAPVPLAGPAALGPGIAIVESMLAAGIVPDATRPRMRRVLATSLRRLFTLTREFTGAAALSRRAVPRGEDRVFPRVHSPVFDFEATRVGAEWIEDLAARAAPTVARDGAGPTVLTHVDFRVEHLRVDGDQLVAVYDWDSLCVDFEAVAVGQVAHAFTIDWSEPVAHVPSVDEATAFVEDYEQVRGRRFDDREWRVARAAWVYSTAYGARCEHALLGSDVDAVPEAFRDRLAAHGEDWLR
jgi:Phosphotransferase enzyme family